MNPEGGLHSGNLEKMNENGYFKVTGRIKDSIIRDSANIYPRKIEEFTNIRRLPMSR
jgi:fatty-acyl-CoA synthase